MVVACVSACARLHVYMFVLFGFASRASTPWLGGRGRHSRWCQVCLGRFKFIFKKLLPSVTASKPTETMCRSAWNQMQMQVKQQEKKQKTVKVRNLGKIRQPKCLTHPRVVHANDAERCLCWAVGPGPKSLQSFVGRWCFAGRVGKAERD